MPDDNSCLFHCIGFCFGGSVVELRSMIAKAILADPFNYNEATLQKSPSAYSSWIQQSNTWGGSVELAIFAEHYQCEIVAFDVARQRHNTFGEERGYQKRIYVVYDGIHYDCLIKEIKGQKDQVIFETKDCNSESMCHELMKKEFKSGKYVDEYTYKIKCGECGQVFIGNSNAVKHATLTGHSNFGQCG